VRVAGSLGVGFGETMYYKGVAEGEDTEGMMMILFGPGEMQLFTEKKATRDLTVYWSCLWEESFSAKGKTCLKAATVATLYCCSLLPFLVLVLIECALLQYRAGLVLHCS